MTEFAVIQVLELGLSINTRSSIKARFKKWVPLNNTRSQASLDAGFHTEGFLSGGQPCP